MGGEMRILYNMLHHSNRAYPENANSNTCAPNTLKFDTFCGLCVTKQCFKFELDILNSSGVIAT